MKILLFVLIFLGPKKDFQLNYYFQVDIKRGYQILGTKSKLSKLFTSNNKPANVEGHQCPFHQHFKLEFCNLAPKNTKLKCN